MTNGESLSESGKGLNKQSELGAGYSVYLGSAFYLC
jgi:hypothetical protein